MKNLSVLFTVILMLVFVSTASAAELHLTWDANAPPVDGYRVFQRAIDGTYDYTVPVWQGPEIIAPVTDLTPGTTYAWVVRAYLGGLESADSNEVQATIPEPPQVIVYPGQPKQLIINFD